VRGEKKEKEKLDFVGVLPDFCMLSAEDFGVEKAVLFARRCLGVRLAANLDALPACH